jgi:hypothetical protein
MDAGGRATQGAVAEGRARPACVKASENRTEMRVLPDQGGGIQVEIAPKGRLASLLTTWGYLRKMGKRVLVRPILSLVGFSGHEGMRIRPIRRHQVSCELVNEGQFVGSDIDCHG